MSLSQRLVASQVESNSELAQMQSEQAPEHQFVQLQVDETPVLEGDAADQAARQLAQQSTYNEPTAEEMYETNECCADANPIVPPEVAIVVLVLNIVAPGIGTYVAAYYDPSGCNCKTVTFGVLQQLLVIVIVGWVWAILQGLAIYRKSEDWYANNSTASAQVTANP